MPLKFSLKIFPDLNYSLASSHGNVGLSMAIKIVVYSAYITAAKILLANSYKLRLYEYKIGFTLQAKINHICYDTEKLLII